MQTPQNSKSIQHWISMITTNLAIIGAFATLVWNGYAKPIVESVADEQIQKWKRDSLHEIVAKEIHSTGGFRGALEMEFNRQGYQIRKDEIPSKFVDAYVWTDSLKLFDKVIKPMLVQEMREYDVGLKVDKYTGETRYLHTDGRTYFPSYDNENQEWYILINGTIVWCQ